MTLLLPAFTVRISHPRAAASRARALAEMVGKFKFGSGVVVVVTGVLVVGTGVVVVGAEWSEARAMSQGGAGTGQS